MRLYSIDANICNISKVSTRGEVRRQIKLQTTDNTFRQQQGRTTHCGRQW